MTKAKYLKDKLLILILNGTCMFLLSLYLLALGDTAGTILLLDISWILICSIWFYNDYTKRKKYFDHIGDLMKNIDQPYLVQEFMEKTWRLEDDLYLDILKRSNKAVIEKIYALEREQKDYREFIEGWIHEVKLPITGIRLAAHGIEPDYRRKIESYLTELDNDVEQALFYARSEQVYKDYLIQEMELKPVVTKVVQKNKHLLIQNHIAVELGCDDAIIYSDSKWVEFILGQILLNAVKYKKADSGTVSFQTEAVNNGIKLKIRDNGIGIQKSELSRVFEKGFTGTNGRNREKSTGIGLYLCKKLCSKLGLQIGIDSEEQKYTEVWITFPKNSFLTKL